MKRVFFIWIAFGLICLLNVGCASSLRCGTDGESSYVDLINVRDLPTNVRYMSALCGFAYVGDSNETT